MELLPFLIFALMPIVVFREESYIRIEEPYRLWSGLNKFDFVDIHIEREIRITQQINRVAVVWKPDYRRIGKRICWPSK